MKRVVSCLSLVGLLFGVAPLVSAGPMVSFYDECVQFSAAGNAIDRGANPVSLVSPSRCGPSTDSLKFAVEGGAVNVDVNGDYRGIASLGFNIAGSRDGLTISNLTPGYRIGDTDVTGVFGTFQYFIYGFGSDVFDGRTLEFTLTRNAGFLSPLDVFAMNENGWLSGALVVDPLLGSLYEFASDVAPVVASPVPEPASMLLLGTGLLAAYGARRRVKC